MNYLGASPRGIKKANAHGESGTDPRVGVLTKKRNEDQVNEMILNDPANGLNSYEIYSMRAVSKMIG